MWLLLAFLSATLLGFYDVFKKQSLKDNAVLPVLFLNTLFSSLIFLPFILVSAFEPDLLGGTIFNVPVAGWEQHKYIIIKSFIVLSSWIFGYFGMKHLPITIVGHHQCYPSGDGACRSNAGVWRASESLPMDQGDAGNGFLLLLSRSGRKKGSSSITNGFSLLYWQQLWELSADCMTSF